MRRACSQGRRDYLKTEIREGKFECWFRSGWTTAGRIQCSALVHVIDNLICTANYIHQADLFPRHPWIRTKAWVRVGKQVGESQVYFKGKLIQCCQVAFDYHDEGLLVLMLANTQAEKQAPTLRQFIFIVQFLAFIATFSTHFIAVRVGFSMKIFFFLEWVKDLIWGKWTELNWFRGWLIDSTVVVWGRVHE